MTHQARHLRLRLTWPVWLVTLLGYFTPLLAAPVAFDIPAQPAPAALQLFIKQSSAPVLFVYDDLKAVQTNAVKGEFEPAAAIDQLLAETGFFAKRNGGKFVVARQQAEKPGSIEGSIRDESGKPLAGAKVALADTDKAVATDKRGRFVLTDVPAGAHALHITAEGMQNTKVTDVIVKSGTELSLSPITVPTKTAGTIQLDTYTVSAKKNDGVLELDPFAVEGQKVKPFVGGNMDIPRTINDAQPYYLFDAKTIEQAGAANIEDFLKRRLTMNTVDLTNGQRADGTLMGNTSLINLRGLGPDKTLVLVNGRRMPGVNIAPNGEGTGQPDINGIPLDAVERIEVLPTSASGIYGGSALGGVVNVILKQNYAGGEIRATYDNTWDSDSPRRTISATYGKSFEDGKTHLMIMGQWSDAKPLLLQDRRGIFEEYLHTVLSNSTNPAFIFSRTTPFPGALPNITATNRLATTLTLKNGVVLPSRNTYVPAGTSPATPLGTLYAGLEANAGQWNFDLPLSTLRPTGLLRPFGVTPRNEAVKIALRRQMWRSLEAFAEFSYSKNHSDTVYNPLGIVSFANVPASAPTNPFTTAVRVKPSIDTDTPISTDSTTRSISLGFKAELPLQWLGQFDYTWSKNRYLFDAIILDEIALNADLASGALNPFVDVRLHPLDLKKYYGPANEYAGASELHDFALRGAGPLIALSWGSPQLAVGFEHRKAVQPESRQAYAFPINTQLNSVTTYFSRVQVTDSAYAELTFPVVKEGRFAWVRTLDIQASGRSERYTQDGGTSLVSVSPNATPPQVNYYPSKDGQPYFSEDSYTSSNGTVGLKYQPVAGLTVRSSVATAFLPPQPSQLIRNPSDTARDIIDDPRNETSYEVQTIGASSGNPNLKPQNSKSWNAGIVWEPQWRGLRGLRLNAEYYRIEQFDAISSLSAQMLVDNESSFPDRVTRDSSGMITQLDLSVLNLYKRDTSGWDFSADYQLQTHIGAFGFHAVQSRIVFLKEQFSLTDPATDAAGLNPGFGGGGPKYRRNASLTWEHRGWSAGWAVQYFGSYGAHETPAFREGQGSDTIPSQMYHDAFVGFSFGGDAGKGETTPGKMHRRLMGGLSVQFGVRNVFDKVAPMDVAFLDNYLLSPYADTRLRSYWISLKQKF